MSLSDQTTTEPPLPFALASALIRAPLATWADWALAMPASSPCQPPPMRTAPPPVAPLASTTAAPESVTSAALASTCPPLPAIPTAFTWPSISSWFMALSTTVPPSRLAVVACISPLWRKVPAKMPTALPCSVPRLRTLSPGACTSILMPSSPRPVISTCWPAASSVLPLGERTRALAPSSMLGATSTTSPLRAVMRPSTLMPPAPPMLALASPKRSRPARASASLMRKADAVKPAVSTIAPAPIAMPDWLTSTSLPLEDRLPKMTDGLLVTTRLMAMLVALGCWKLVLLPAAIEKLCQLMAEWLVPAPFWVTTLSSVGVGVLKLA